MGIIIDIDHLGGSNKELEQAKAEILRKIRDIKGYAHQLGPSNETALARLVRFSPRKCLPAEQEICRALLKAGVDPDHKSSHQGYTPLQQTAIVGRVDLAKILVEGGADTSIKCKIEADGIDITPADIVNDCYNDTSKMNIDEARFTAFENSLRDPDSADWDSAIKEMESEYERVEEEERLENEERRFAPPKIK